MELFRHIDFITFIDHKMIYKLEEQIFDILKVAAMTKIAKLVFFRNVMSTFISVSSSTEKKFQHLPIAFTAKHEHIFFKTFPESGSSF